MPAERESGECIVRPITAAVFCLLLALAPAAVRAADCNTVTVTAHPGYPPVAWSEEGALVGVGPSLVRLLAQGSGVELELVDHGNWAAALAAVREGRTDAVVGLYFNSERAERMMFIQPAFIMDPVAIFVRSEPGFFYTSRDSLIGRKGVANEGESYGQSLDGYINIRLSVDRAPSTAVGLTRLVRGEADYMISGLLPGRAELKRLALEESVAVADPRLVAEPMFIAVGRDSPCRNLVMGWRNAVSMARQYRKIDALVADAEEAWASRGGGAQ